MFILIYIYYCVCVWRKKLCNCHHFLLFVFFSLANLDGLTKVARRLLTCVELDECGLILRHWKTLRDKYLFQPEISCVKTWYAMCFRENNNRGSKRACKCYQCFSWCKLNLILGKQHLPEDSNFTKSYHCFS